MIQTLLLLVLSSPGVSEPGQLEMSVKQYWDFLQDGQRERAARFVLAESRQHFDLRREPAFLSWRLLGITEISATSAQAAVSVERWIQGGLFDQKIVETWNWDGAEWKVRVEDPVQARKDLWQGPGLRPREGELRILPESLRFHLLDKSQKDVLVILNGLDVSVEVLGFEVDPGLFETAESVSKIEARQTGRITLKYKGKGTAIDSASSGVLVLKHGSEETRVQVPIIYNYVSPGARGLFQLSGKSAAELRKKAPATAKASRPQE